MQLCRGQGGARRARAIEAHTKGKAQIYVLIKKAADTRRSPTAYAAMDHAMTAVTLSGAPLASAVSMMACAPA